MATAELTATEKQFLENFDEGGKSVKHAFQLQVKKIHNSRYAFLNSIKGNNRYFGNVQMIDERGKSVWYFNAIDGETYRIPEPADGIDSYFDIEAKRNDV